MGRWGEEEKKSKGIFGCLIAGAIFVLFCYTFYINYQNLENRRTLEKRMEVIIYNGKAKTDKQLEKEILAVAQELDFTLNPEDVYVHKYRDEYTNYMVDVSISIPAEVDLLVTSFTVPLPIERNGVVLLDY